MNDNLKSLGKMKHLHNALVSYRVHDWLKYDFLHFQWWILVCFLIIPWILWFIFVDKNRILFIFAFGLLYIVITTIFDGIGNDLDFWLYPFYLFPYSPESIAFDFSMVPVAFMFCYQFGYSNWKQFIFLLTFMAVTYAFIGEPISVQLHLVEYEHWRYSYSFLFYLVLGVLLKLFIDKLRAVQDNG